MVVNSVPVAVDSLLGVETRVVEYARAAAAALLMIVDASEAGWVAVPSLPKL